MEIFGVLALIILVFYSNYPGKVNRLEAKIGRMERKLRGDKSMSKLIEELINKRCVIKINDRVITLGGDEKLNCLVVDTDGEWVESQIYR